MGTWQDPWAIDAPLVDPTGLGFECEAADGWRTEDGPCRLPAIGWRLHPDELTFRDSLTPWPAFQVHA